MNGKSEPSRAKSGRTPVDRRSEILDAAEHLYADVGFEKTTVTDLARHLGMSPANLYRHFPNRQSIDDHIALRKLTVIEDAAWKAARGASQDARASFRAMVLAVMNTTLELQFSEQKLHQLCVVAIENKWPVVDQLVQNLQGAVRHVIIEGRNAGVFHIADPDVSAGAVFWSLLRVWHPQMLALYRDEHLEALAHSICDLILASLEK
jgi:AcrR family transcriptional regulator